VKTGGKQLFIQIIETGEVFPLKYLHVLNGKERTRAQKNLGEKEVGRIAGIKRSSPESDEGSPSPRAVSPHPAAAVASGGRVRFWFVVYDPVDQVTDEALAGQVTPDQVYQLSQECFVTQKEGYSKVKVQQGQSSAPRYQVLACAVITKRACDQGRGGKAALRANSCASTTSECTAAGL
jgi:hypothetical protein